MTPPVAVVVVNWNGRRYLERCLSGLLAQSYPNVEPVLVDNGSTDGSVDLVRERFPEVRLIQSPTNLGFAAANNLAFWATDTPYVATLNNDTELTPGWLAALVQAMDGDERVGMCASKMLFFGDPGTINSTGVCMDAAGIAWDRRGGEPDSPDEIAPVEVFGACAGAALYRREMLLDVALPPAPGARERRLQFFDEDYFAYLEDVDLAWRAQLAGWRCLYVPAARLYHVHSGTLQEGSPFKNFLLARNKLWTIVKNYPTRQLVRALPAILFYDLGTIPYTLLVRGDASALKGRLAALRALRPVLARRRYVQQRWSSNQTWTSHLAPLQGPLAVLRRYAHLRQLTHGSGDP